MINRSIMAASTSWSLSSLMFVRYLRTHVACRLPRRVTVGPQGEASARVALPLSEKELQAIAQEQLVKDEVPETPKKRRPTRISALKDEPEKEKKGKPKKKEPPQPVTEENQFQRLAETVTPLCEVPYVKQLKIKERYCRSVLQQLGQELNKVRAPLERTANKLPCVLEPIRHSPELVAYRNKDEFGVYSGVDGNPKTVGFFIGRPRESNLVCVPPSRLINVKESHKLVAESFQSFIRQSPHEACHNFQRGGLWRSMVVRSTTAGERMAAVIIHPHNLTEEGIQEVMEELRTYFFEGEGAECELDSLYLQACPHTRCTREQAPYRLIAGKEYITETCLDLTFQISPDSFFQINTRGAEVLYNTIKEVAEVSPITTLLDVCCGTGTISLAMAPAVRGTIGIDVVTGAVEDARKNAQRNNIENSVFMAGKAEEVLPRLTKELNQCADVVAVVNPARQGLHRDVIRSLRRCEAIQKLIYVSCKPDGDAMKNFVHLGTPHKATTGKRTVPFLPKYAVPIDMFPHTNHTELVMLFERV